MSVLVLLVILLCVVTAAWSRLRKHPNAPPEYPGALPIFGHSLLLLGDRKHLWNFLQKTQRYSIAKGGVIELWYGTRTVYITTDPDDSLTLANSCLGKPFMYDFSKDFINNGLITAETSLWKYHRKLLNPAFNQQVLNTYVQEMNVQARNLVSQLACEVGKGPFDVRNYFVKFSLIIVTRTSLGLNSQDQTIIDTDYAEAFEDLVASFCDRFQKVWLHFSCLFNLSEMKRKQTKLIKTLANILDPIIHKRKSEIKAIKDVNTFNDSTTGQFKPVLTRMLQLADEQGAFTDDDIREHLNTLVAAAYDTTASALTYILIVIGSHREVQQRIFNEIQEVLEHNNDDITKQDLPKLVYLEAVIKETLRLYPMIAIIGRKIDKELNLKNCTLRAGSTCLIGLYGLLRHPMWGADVEQFRPERWLDPATLSTHPGLYAAFGVGKRNCIGKLFSMMLMKTVLAHIVRRYRVTGNIDNVIGECDVVLKPLEGHHITLIPRS